MSSKKVGITPLILTFLAFTLPVEYAFSERLFTDKLRFWGLVDGFSHSLIGAMVLFPLFRVYNLKTFAFAFLSSGILDVDHIIIVGSVDFHDIMLLIERPPTHSITFALLAGGIFYLIFRKAFLFFWVFLAISQHVIRDGISDVTPLLYPLEVYNLPFWLYLALEVALILVAAFVGRNLKNYPKAHGIVEPKK